MRGRVAAETTVVVLGAGINGAALARELLLSGVRVVVAEADDVACGATAWSTRLVHGGLRYLEYGEVDLVRESLRERDRLVRLAPHLVRPLGFLLPVRSRLGGLAAAAARIVGLESLARAWRGRGRGSIAVGIGLTLYDALAAAPGWPRHRTVATGVPGLPAVDARAFPHAAVYADAQMLFPERFTVELLVDARRIAAEQGTSFSLLTHAAAAWDAGGELRIVTAAGDAVAVRPAAIVNATGAWVDRTRAEILPRSPRRLIGGTKGSHLVLAAPALRAALGDHGVYAEADDGRPVFVLPFGPRLVLVGTTDIPFAGDPATARTDDAEITYLLAAVARLFPQAAPPRDAVLQHYCGVRPLPAADAATPASVTRRHMLVRHADAPLPIWSIVGGKLTTCRSLAEQSAAEVLGVLGLPVRTTSRERPLPGSLADDVRPACIAEAERLLLAAGVDVDRVAAAAECTVALFGARGIEVCRRAAAQPHGFAPLLPGSDLPTAAVGFAVEEEWAVSLADVVERRLMLSFAEILPRATLAAVADELVRLGRLPAEGAEEAVVREIERLHDHHGKHVA